MRKASIRLRPAPQEAAKRTAKGAGLTTPRYFAEIIREYAAGKAEKQQRPKKWEREHWRETRVELDDEVLERAQIRAAAESISLSTVVHRVVVKDALELRQEEGL